MTNIPDPTSKIILAGTPARSFEAKVETATGVKPGTLVKKGSTDDDIVVCTASDFPVGVIGFEETAPLQRPADIDTAYTKNTRAKVHSGGGFTFYGWLGKTEADDVVFGEPLVPTDDGCLATGTSSGKAMFFAAESKASSTAAARIKVEMR